MKTKKLVIIGATSNAKLAKYFFDTDSDYEVAAFSVDEAYITEPLFRGLPVVPFEEVEKSYPPDQYDAFVAIGYSKMNKIREKLYHDSKSKGYKLPNYISSRCSYLTQEPIGDNNLILEDNTIQPFETIGSNNVFWSGNHIGHEGSIGDHNTITSHVVISGFVKIASNCFFGVNATIRDAISIASETLVAAGAIIMKDTVEKGVYLPARSMLFDKKSDEIIIS
ncbi:MAG: acetyltransferase [Nitrososphaera sp.]|nr:acetyltransferase [Nitrososphaera sp.]